MTMDNIIRATANILLRSSSTSSDDYFSLTPSPLTQLEQTVTSMTATTTAPTTPITSFTPPIILNRSIGKYFPYNDIYNFSYYHHKLFNETLYHSYHTCPSLQMPVGNLISMILYAVICIIGLFGNTLVIYVVLRFSKMQTVTNMYILNLAIADECFLIGIPFLIRTMHLGEWTFGNTMCKAYMVSTSITQFTSSIFLFIMSADRYIAVCHPISASRYRSPVVSRVVSAVAWIASALIMLPVFLYSTTIEKSSTNNLTCNIGWPLELEDGSGITFTLYSLILGFAVPLCFILVFYYLVIRKLRTVGPKTKSKEKKRSHRKVTKLVLTVITVYVLCWLPYWISQVALINSPPYVCQSRLEITIFVLVGCLCYSNSAMNPILYAFLSDNFKKSFLKACTCAAGKELNAQLQMENSLFPRFGKRGSEKGCSIKSGVVNKKTITSPDQITPMAAIDICSAEQNDPNKINSSFDVLTKSNTNSTSLNEACRPPVLHTAL